MEDRAQWDILLWRSFEFCSELLEIDVGSWKLSVGIRTSEQEFRRKKEKTETHLSKSENNGRNSNVEIMSKCELSLKHVRRCWLFCCSGFWIH